MKCKKNPQQQHIYLLRFTVVFKYSTRLSDFDQTRPSNAFSSIDNLNLTPSLCDVISMLVHCMCFLIRI